MFPSTFSVFTPIPRVQSRQAQSVGLSIITLDFGRTSHGKPKRSSFLPGSWLDDPQDPTQAEDKYAFQGASIFRPTKEYKYGSRTVREFCTGSKYNGEYNKLGMAGKGIYKFPHGVIYDGFFNKKGEFHGTGSLIYPGGQRVEGIWRNGKLVKGASCVTPDNIPFANQYCRMPDRRFQIEVQNDLAPAGQEYLTNAPNPPRKVKEGCYDTGEGFYDPKEKVLHDYNDPCSIKPLCEFASVDLHKQEVYDLILNQTESQMFLLGQLRQQKIGRSPEILSIPTDVNERWIIDNCRRAWDEPTGYRQDLYESFTTGKRIIDRARLTIPSDVKTDDDKIIEQLAQIHGTGSANPSTLFSFIMAPDDTRRDRSASLIALSRMLIPRIDDREFLKDQVVKRSRVYQIKRKSRKSKKPSSTRRIKSNDLRHFYTTYAAKFKAKLREVDQE